MWSGARSGRATGDGRRATGDGRFHVRLFFRDYASAGTPGIPRAGVTQYFAWSMYTSNGAYAELEYDTEFKLGRVLVDPPGQFLPDAVCDKGQVHFRQSTALDRVTLSAPYSCFPEGWTSAKSWWWSSYRWYSGKYSWPQRQGNDRTPNLYRSITPHISSNAQ